MQAVGILLITVGVWLVYCGVTGVPPLETALAILRNPNNAEKIIQDAKKKAADEADGVTSGYRRGSGGTFIPNFTNATNPFSKYRITEDFASHKARSSSNLGGVDFAMPSGTPLPSVFDGTFTWSVSPGMGGTATVTLDNGWKSQYLHCTKPLVSSGKRVKAGEIIALSGGGANDPNRGTSTGPHLHWHMVNPQGVRVDPLEYIKGGAGKSTHGGVTQ